jgi:hypothetical protein
MMGRKEAEDRDWVLGWEAVSMSDVREIDAASITEFGGTAETQSIRYR